VAPRAAPTRRTGVWGRFPSGGPYRVTLRPARLARSGRAVVLVGLDVVLLVADIVLLVTPAARAVGQWPAYWWFAVAGSALPVLFMATVVMTGVVSSEGGRHHGEPRWRHSRRLGRYLLVPGLTWLVIGLAVFALGDVLYT